MLVYQGISGHTETSNNKTYLNEGQTGGHEAMSLRAVGKQRDHGSLFTLFGEAQLASSPGSTWNLLFED